MDRTDSLLTMIVVLLALILLEVSGGDSIPALLVLAAVPLYAVGYVFSAVLKSILFESGDDSRGTTADELNR